MTELDETARTLPGWTDELEFSPPASLRVDVTALKREPGTQRTTRIVVKELEGVARPSVDMEGKTVAVDVVLEHLGAQLTAAGLLHAEWQAPCRRCLEPIVAVAETRIHEIFERTPVEGETYALEEEFVDLRPMVSEALALALPLSPLCREDCPGPDPERFSPTGDEDGDANDAADEDDARPVDDRWSALDALVFDNDD